MRCAEGCWALWGGQYYALICLSSSCKRPSRDSAAACMAAAGRASARWALLWSCAGCSCCYSCCDSSVLVLLPAAAAAGAQACGCCSPRQHPVHGRPCSSLCGLCCWCCGWCCCKWGCACCVGGSCWGCICCRCCSCLVLLLCAAAALVCRKVAQLAAGCDNLLQQGVCWLLCWVGADIAVALHPQGTQLLANHLLLRTQQRHSNSNKNGSALCQQLQMANRHT
jgi:hypothetical protein